MTTAKEPKYKAQTGTATLERPRYSPGLLLEAEDLTSAVTYTQNMMRLMFRSLFGCGLICGLDVAAELKCNRSRVDVTIAKGVALDCLGNPIELPKGAAIQYDSDCDTMPATLWVVVCYRESCCRTKDVSCGEDDGGGQVQTRVKDGFEVRLYPYWPKCVCSCEPPPKGKTRTPGDCCDDEDDTTPERASSTSAQAAQAARAATTSNTANIAQGDDDNEDEDEEDTPALPPLCDCYQEHYDGKCSCDCCCPCVLVGKVETTLLQNGTDPVDTTSNDPQALYVDRRWVRWIRPVLVGYYKCIKAVASAAV